MQNFLRLLLEPIHQAIRIGGSMPLAHRKWDTDCVLVQRQQEQSCSRYTSSTLIKGLHIEDLSCMRQVHSFQTTQKLTVAVTVQLCNCTC